MATATQSDPVVVPPGPSGIVFNAPSSGDYWFTPPATGYQEKADIGVNYPANARAWVLYGQSAGGALTEVAGPATGMGSYSLRNRSNYVKYLLKATLQEGDSSLVVLTLLSEAP